MGIKEYLERRRARREARREQESTTFDIRKFLEAGGTQVATTTEEAQEMATQFLGGGGITSPTTTPTPTTTTTYYPDVKLPEITPTPSITKTQQQLRGEIYDPRREIYRESVYGVGGTQFERIPTQEERRRMEQAQEKLSKTLKYIEDPTGKRALEEPKDIWGETYTYKQLYEAGAYPAAIRKGVSDVGRFFVTIGEKITGGEVPPRMKTQTAQAIGTLFLFAGFSQAMRTGTYSEEISKQLSKTKFDKLKELLGKAEKQIAEQKTLEAQRKILKQIKDGLKTPEQIKNYNKWVQDLKEKGIMHQVKVDVKQLGEYKPSVTGEIAIEIPTQIPVEKIGVIAIDPSKVRDVSWVGEKAKVDQVQEPLSMNIFQEVSKTKTGLISTTALRLKQRQISKLDIKQEQKFIQPLKEISKVKQVELQKQVQLQKQRQIQRERLVQLQKQIQVSRLKAELKPRIKIPFKFGDAIDRVKKIVKEKPEVFEAWGKRFGKEVKLGIFKTKPEAEKKLGKFLVKTLGAAGFLTKDRKKLKATEIELLKKKEFRISKLSEFLVIEKKEKRLRRKTTGREIQYFRQTPRKGRKKGKSLFGI